MNDFIKALNSKNAGRVILVTFKNGDCVEYTENILNLLMTDSSVENISSAETGEIIYYRDERGEMIAA